ncbi:MAG: hypothetical protein Terrestrivirus4_79 [Terrestrivirus sp.]|uniref:Uncharacterized protein n=1 Tax=Terrestrivirus sp. TaxID=2487775 RepID=A0A3G4ZPX8_9VIRU|nr:MAG: hypothetical protein Terrestrivirus4_79 [Terrestrivirus sp.]
MTALTKDILYDVMSSNITDFNRIYSIHSLNKLLPNSVPHKMVIENNHGYGHCTRIRVIEYDYLGTKYFIQFRYSGGSCAGCDTDERDMSQLYNPEYESYKEDSDDETIKVKLSEEEIKEKYKKNTEIVLRNLKQKCYMAKIVTSLDDLTKPPILNNNNNNNNDNDENNESYDEDKLNEEIDKHNEKYD